MSDNNFNTYFIVDDVSAATSVIEILRKANIDEDNLGVVSRDSDIAVADLPEVDITEKSKLPGALGRGAAIGTGSGLLAGLLLSVFPVAGIAIGGAAIAGMAAGGAAMGAWSAGMIGISEDSPLVAEFEGALDNQKTLIFARLPVAQKQTLCDEVMLANQTGKVRSGDITAKE